jgi:hypothetical protein
VKKLWSSLVRQVFSNNIQELHPPPSGWSRPGSGIRQTEVDVLRAGKDFQKVIFGNWVVCIRHTPVDGIAVTRGFLALGIFLSFFCEGVFVIFEHLINYTISLR